PPTSRPDRGRRSHRDRPGRRGRNPGARIRPRHHPAHGAGPDLYQGYYWGVLIVGMDRSTDNVTPQSQLKYEVFIDGLPFGPAVDQGSESGVWAWFQGPSVPGPVLSPGQHTVTAKAQDAAGNWSAPSKAQPVTG